MHKKREGSHHSETITDNARPENEKIEAGTEDQRLNVATPKLRARDDDDATRVLSGGSGVTVTSVLTGRPNEEPEPETDYPGTVTESYRPRDQVGSMDSQPSSNWEMDSGQIFGGIENDNINLREEDDLARESRLSGPRRGYNDPDYPKEAATSALSLWEARKRQIEEAKAQRAAYMEAHAKDNAGVEGGPTQTPTAQVTEESTHANPAMDPW